MKDNEKICANCEYSRNSEDSTDRIYASSVCTFRFPVRVGTRLIGHEPTHYCDLFKSKNTDEVQRGSQQQYVKSLFENVIQGGVNSLLEAAKNASGVKHSSSLAQHLKEFTDYCLGQISARKIENYLYVMGWQQIGSSGFTCINHNHFTHNHRGHTIQIHVHCGEKDFLTTTLETLETLSQIEKRPMVDVYNDIIALEKLQNDSIN